jgi:nucleoside-triphosphatase
MRIVPIIGGLAESRFGQDVALLGGAKNDQSDYLRPERMNNKVLLTGRPGCGKTTLIKRVINEISRPADGFYTEEIRERGARVGFKLITFNGQESVIAHINFKTPQRVGKYGLNLSGLENIGVKAIRQAVCAGCLAIIDEIGPMEIRSHIFCDVVNEALKSDVPILATITARPFPFTNRIKTRSDVSVIEIRLRNRDELVSELADHFKK